MNARHGANRVRYAVEAQASAWGGLRSKPSPDESAVIDELKANLLAAKDGQSNAIAETRWLRQIALRRQLASVRRSMNDCHISMAGLLRLTYTSHCYSTHCSILDIPL
ncbi:hypothetical protein CFIO01_05708 [Colletotrichum fioriniae PJ7]|uniref:Uncharacterized protein n=1 Tax=Colletotrichum fioriniae PJ7 TaxID=1445577 RepID=A0A010RZ12_9PEZI|nr:hypothetical protein CFIO01_05708 [Colletotrichum fioriniae PJ7]